MTIDDNVDFLNEAKDFFEDVANNPKIKETIKTYLIIESLETAIDTMRKYQQIQEFFKSYWGIQEQDIMDAIHGKSYDNRWHSVINEKDFEMLVLSQTDKEPTVEARLKADMVAMLTELESEMNSIKECEQQIYGKEHWNFVGKCQDAIQQKINALKAESEVEDG